MRKALILLSALFAAGCANYSNNLPSIKPYKMDIQQGNVVTAKMMMQLRPGMTKAQVRYIMGTPLITDSFHANRWDYFYRMVKGGKIIEQRHIILEFENDQLKRVRGDVIPADSGEQGAVELSKPAEPKKEKGLLDSLKFWKSDEEQAPAPAKTEAQPAPAPVQKTVPAPEPVPTVPQKAEPAKVEPAPAPATKPEVVAPAKAQPAPVETAKPASVAPVKPEAVPVEPRKTIPADELPPEDDPSFFERMLEKIGF
jgi:outer membrane protein assembly factor BamE